MVSEFVGCYHYAHDCIGLVSFDNWVFTMNHANNSKIVSIFYFVFKPPLTYGETPTLGRANELERKQNTKMLVTV